MLAMASATLLSAAASSALSRSSAARDCLSAVSATSRRACALGEQRLRAVEFELSQRHLRLVADDGPSRCVDVLLGDVELAHLGVERGLGDRHLLLVVGVVDPGDDRARLDRLSFVEGKFDDARLDRLEAEDALVGLDVAGDEDKFAVGLSFDPRDKDVLKTVGGGAAEPQNHRQPNQESPHGRHENHPPQRRPPRSLEGWAKRAQRPREWIAAERRPAFDTGQAMTHRRVATDRRASVAVTPL